MTRQIAQGVHFAGVGEDTAHAEGILFVTPAASDADLADGDITGSLGSYEIVPAIDPRATDLVGFTSSPFRKGGVGSSAIKLQMPARDDLVERFLHVEHKTTITLAENLQDNEATVELDLSGTSKTTGQLEDTVVRIDHESIQLGTYNSSSGEFENCTRGYWGSAKVAHDVGSNVYANHTPEWDGRRVQLFEIDLEAHTLDRVWRGEIHLSKDQEIQFTPDGANIEIPCRDPTAPTESVRPQEHRPSSESKVSVNRFSDRDTRTAGYVGGIQSTSWSVEKPNTTSTKYDHEAGIGWRIGDTLVVEDRNNLVFHGSGAYQPLLGSPAPEAVEGDAILARADLDRRPHEVFYVDKQADEQVTDFETFANGPDDPIPISRTRELDDQPDSKNGVDIYKRDGEAAYYRYHPLAVAMAFELSTDGTDTRPAEFDIFRGSWSLDRRDLYEPGIVTKVHRLIQKTRALTTVQQAVLGWEPGPVEITDYIDEVLLHPFFQRGITESGDLTIYLVAPADVVDLLDAQDGAFNYAISPMPDEGGDGMLHYRSGRGATLDELEVEVDGLPWREPQSLLARADDQDPNRAMASDEVELSIDMRTVASSREAIRIAEQFSIIQKFQMPRFRWIAETPAAHGDTYDVGTFLGLDDLELDKPWLPNPDGSRVTALLQKAEFAALLTGRKYRMLSGAWELDGLMTNYVSGQTIKLRAPPAIVIDYETDGSGNVTAVWVSPTSEFGASGSDADELAAGDDVYFCKQNGADVGGGDGAQIDSIASSTATSPNGKTGRKITLSPTAPVASDLSNGDVMRFENFDEYDNPGHGGEYITGFQIYVWLADGDATVGSGDAEASIYG